LGTTKARPRIHSHEPEVFDGKGETVAAPLTREHIMNNMCHNVTKLVKKKVTLWH
jgi:hypothetical protein